MKKKEPTRPLRFRISETFEGYVVVDVPISVDYESSHEYVEGLCNAGDIDIIKEDGINFTRHVDLVPFKEE